MKFNLENLESQKEAREYLDKLIAHKSNIEIVKKFTARSLSQNNLLHLLLSYCALNTGETLEYFKQYIWKMYICPDIFKEEYINPLTDEERIRWRSSRELNTKEMTQAIEKLRNWSALELGIELPDISNTEAFNRIENEIHNNRGYL